MYLCMIRLDSRTPI